MLDPSPPAVEAWAALKKLHALLSRRLQHDYARLNLTSAQYMALRDLLKGPSTASALAAKQGVTTANLTGVIDRLEAAGLVERGRHVAPNGDRRAVTLSLTRKGEVLALEARGTLRGTVQELLSPLSEDALAGLNATLKTLLAAVEAAEETKEVNA
ncbi:MAG TPA: MarR family transcriptional regulator [Deinococcales bacterium]|nr:MarR family transcriptional regulator [Deinococcales bacterium]